MIDSRRFWLCFIGNYFPLILGYAGGASLCTVLLGVEPEIWLLSLPKSFIFIHFFFGTLAFNIVLSGLMSLPWEKWLKQVAKSMPEI